MAKQQFDMREWKIGCVVFGVFLKSLIFTEAAYFTIVKITYIDDYKATQNSQLDNSRAIHRDQLVCKEKESHIA